MEEWIEVFPRQRLRYLLNLVLEESLSSFKFNPLGQSMWNDIGIGESIGDLNIPEIEIWLNDVGKNSGVLVANAVVSSRVEHEIAID